MCDYFFLSFSTFTLQLFSSRHSLLEVIAESNVNTARVSFLLPQASVSCYGWSFGVFNWKYGALHLQAPVLLGHKCTSAHLQQLQPAHGTGVLILQQGLVCEMPPRVLVPLRVRLSICLHRVRADI